MSNPMLRAKQSWLSVLVFVGALTALAPTASANLTVCNRTSANLIFAFAVEAPTCTDPLQWNHYALSGWFNLSSNQCFVASPADLTRLGASWTAAQGASSVWGWENRYMVPNIAHNQQCLRTVYNYCNNGGSCRNSPHYFISSGKRDRTLEILPYNDYRLN
jgi:hypothetical protein